MSAAADNDTVVPAKSTGKEERKAKAPQEPALKCPRCDSSNTKFCYYNNYSLSQPRHFCKTCKRYWTRGGALRNVPIGGGCRKSKKIKSSCHSIGASDHVGVGLKLFQGITSSPAMDFQLGGFPARLQLEDYTTDLLNQFSSLGGDASNPCFGGFNFPALSSSPLNQGESIGGTVNSNLTSSIETLSSINQDLHWKLQQQRLAMLFVDDNSRKLESGGVSSISSKQEAAGGIIGSSTNLSTEWFFDNSYAPVSTPIPPNGDGNANEAPWSCNMNQYGAFS